jgi:hypothetical protein
MRLSVEIISIFLALMVEPRIGHIYKIFEDKTVLFILNLLLSIVTGTSSLPDAKFLEGNE